MVEKMNKVTLLFNVSYTEELLEELQRLGLYHIQAGETAKTRRVTRLEERIGGLEAARKSIEEAAGAGKDAAASTGPDASAAEGARTLDEEKVIEDISEIRGALSEAEKREQELRAEIADAAPWESFDPARMGALKDAGYRVRLFTAARGSMPAIMAACGGGACLLEIVREEHGLAWFAAVYPEAEGAPAIKAAEQAMPARSLESLREEEGQAARSAEEARRRLAGMAPLLPGLLAGIQHHKNELARALAGAGLSPAAEGQLHIVTGWVPRSGWERMSGFLERKDVLFLTEKAGPADTVPVLVKNHPFSRLFEPIMRIFSLPSYTELDTTPFLAPFYAVFFGLCVADLFYGMFLLAAVGAAFLVMRERGMRPLLFLGLILSGSVGLMGIFLNEAGGLPISSLLGKGSALGGMVLFPTMYGAMYLAIALGVIQVILGRILRIVNSVKAHGPSGALEPTGVVLILLGAVVFALGALGPGFAIGPLQVGRLAVLIPHSRTVAFTLLAGGLALLLFFNNPGSRIWARPGLGLWELYELATGTIGDVLSYLRLFALGLAGALLSQAILKVGMMVKGDRWWGWIPFALVVLLGSGINLAIGCLSAFVHSLRLTFVEFYKSVGFKGGGVEYAPLKKV